MMSNALYLCLLIYIFPVITTAATTRAYTASDFILLNCGNSSTSNDINGRSWAGDEHSKYVPSNAAAISSGAGASYMDSSVFDVPYKAARFFHTPFTYSFPVVTGPKFLRLYFYPNIYSDFNTSQSLFSVTVNAFTLLSNFSAYLYSKNSSRPSFMREFVLPIDEKQSLDLTFSPNPNSFAFVNGIEIVSCPDTLYFRGNYIRFENRLFFLENSTALENLYRLNVGGAYVDINGDTGMFRAWSPDDDYIFGTDFGYTPHLENVQVKYSVGTPPYTAPAMVYTSARVMANYSISLEWIFEVDSGFYYLLRLHYCEFMLEIRAQNQRVFTVNINNQTTDYVYDVIMEAGGPDVPIFKDYITWVPDDGRRGKQHLRLSLYPYPHASPKYLSALLNGLEMFKLSDSNRSLAAANPELAKDSSNPTFLEKPPAKKSRGSTLVYAAAGSAIGVVAVVAMSALIYLRCRKVNDSVTTSKSWVLRSTTRSSGSGASLPSNICRYFSLDEIKTATRNFDDDFVIGEGRFGKVYKGLSTMPPPPWQSKD